MREEDENLPRPRPARLTPPVLDMWGVEELQDYIGELRGEIGRVEGVMARKTSHRSAAEAFFKKS